MRTLSSSERRRRAAPPPAAFPTARTSSRAQSGIRPRTIAYSGSIWDPKAPARRISSGELSSSCSRRRSMPARRAAFASWIARTSFWVTTIVCSLSASTPSYNTNEKVRSSSIMRRVNDLLSSTVPSAAIKPLRKSSPITSIIPEPQMPVTPDDLTASTN